MVLSFTVKNFMSLEQKQKPCLAELIAKYPIRLTFNGNKNYKNNNKLCNIIPVDVNVNLCKFQTNM